MNFLCLIIMTIVNGIYIKEERGGVALVDEKTYHAGLSEFKNILYFYHNELNQSSTVSQQKLWQDFRKDFISNSSKIRRVNQTIKLGIFDMDMTMETSTKLELTYYPTLRLFIDQKLVSDSNVTLKQIQNSDDVVVWYKKALLDYALDQERLDLIKYLKQFDTIQVIEPDADFKGYRLFISRIIKDNQYSLIYCGRNDHQLQKKYIEKLNSTANNFNFMQCYYHKSIKSQKFCPENSFLLVKLVNTKEEDYVTFPDNIHLSYLTKALRKELNGINLIYGNQKKMIQILNQSILGVFEENMLYTYLDFDKDDAIQIKSNRITNIEKALQQFSQKDNKVQTFLGDIFQNHMKKIQKQHGLEIFSPPYIIYIDQSQQSPEIYVKKILKNQTYEFVQQFYVDCTKGIQPQFRPTSESLLVEMKKRKYNFKFLRQEDLQQSLSQINQFALIIFVNNPRNNLENCQDCQDLGLAYQAIFKQLYLEYDVHTELIIVNLQQQGEESKIKTSLLTSALGLSKKQAKKFQIPESLMYYNNTSVIIDGQYPEDINNVIQRMGEQLGIQFETMSVNVIDRIIDTKKQLLFEKKFKNTNFSKQINKREAVFQKNIDDL